MRIAVISDIHANCFALDAALADLRGQSVDRIVWLGDIAQGGAQPAETIERLRSLKCPIVMGNADAWLLNEADDIAEPVSQQQREVRGWTISKLSTDEVSLLRGFPLTIEISLSGNERLLCFHGSPYSYDDVLAPETPRDDWDRLLSSFSPAIMAGGHAHTQHVRRVGMGLFFNPGSGGVVYNNQLPKERFHTDPWAEYAILSYDHERVSLDFRRVPYHVEDLIEIIKASGRPLARRAPLLCHMFSSFNAFIWVVGVATKLSG